jgi:hypothetical protein
MSMPFTGPAPSEVRVSITGASASPWNLKPTFTDNFGLKATVRGALPGAGSYQVKVSSADTGAYTRAYLLTGIRPNTRSLTMTLTGGGDLPASFDFDAVADVKPCTCDSLDVRLRADRNLSTSSRASLPLDWTVECAGGAGKCRGAFSISGDAATRAAGIRLGHGGDLQSTYYPPVREAYTVRCDGNCAAPTSGTRYLTVWAPDGAALGREVRSVTVVVERTCGRQLATKLYTIAFGAGGVVSARRSDLNGNGVADGREKK